MASKNTKSSSKNKISKSSKNVMNLADKLKILDLSGEKVANIARKYSVNKSTVRSTRQNEKEYEIVQQKWDHILNFVRVPWKLWRICLLFGYRI